MLIGLQVFSFVFALWLGFYLLARDLKNWRLRFTGLGLVAYALGLAGDVLIAQATDVAQLEALTRFRWALLFLPSLFWFGTVTESLPEDSPIHERLPAGWRYSVLVGGIALVLIGSWTNIILRFEGDTPRLTAGYGVFALIVVVPVSVAFYLTMRHFNGAIPQRSVSLMSVASIFFALGVAILVLPFDLVPIEIMALAIGIDLIVLGLVIAIMDAFDLGEALLPHMARSLVFSCIVALGLGGQIALVLLPVDGVTFNAVLLILTLTTTGVFVVTFANPLQSLLDRVVYARFPQIRAERDQLRAVSVAVSRRAESPTIMQMDDKEFARLTRRALSHYGDLTKLAASPLTRLPVIDARLQQREARDDTLERAQELKALLTESITRLKPRGDDLFGTSDEWRYYNALYFPYVQGIKPYSRRLSLDDLDAITREALTWFRVQVPERTLYNWQNAAAKLIAQDLRERAEALIEV